MVGVSVNSVRFLCPSFLGCPVASESDGDFSLISIVWLSSGELSGVSKRFGLSGVVSSISSRVRTACRDVLGCVVLVQEVMTES